MTERLTLALVDSFGEERYQKSLDIAKGWLLRSVFTQIETGRSDVRASLSEDELALVVHSLSVAELIALEFMDIASNDRGDDEQSKAFQSACIDAFYLTRALPAPRDTTEKIKRLLRMASFAALGDRTADIARWLREQEMPSSPVGEEWPVRLFHTISEAFLRIIRKGGWDDLHFAAIAIAELRDLQKEFEQTYLDSVGDCQHVAAIELVSLYHLAKAIEILGSYCAKGAPKDVVDDLKFQFHQAIKAASTGSLVELEVLLRWVRAASLRLAQNSVWWLLRSFNSQISEHVKNIAAESRAQPMLELLPPQRRAILDDGLLDPAHRAVVVQMPTSSGKTLLAEFRILQARNSFPNSWIAYLAPTRALVSQIALRLRKDLGPLGVEVECAAPALEVDVFEEEWLESNTDADIVVTTPEKLDLLIRGQKRDSSKRPLGLVILDEAHNIADRERGLRSELLLAMINREFPDAQFLLLTPFVPNGSELASWLDADRSRSIEVLAADWQPNDRAFGLVYPEGSRRDWGLRFRSLHTMPSNVEVERPLALENGRPPLSMPVSEVRRSKSRVAAATARMLARRKNSSTIVLADSPNSTWRIADCLYSDSSVAEGGVSDRVQLVQRFLEAEYSRDFQLIDLLERGIAVHHAGLSPEVRFLLEWLTELGEIDILVATTTLAQGVNFPVSSIVLATHYHYQPYKGTVPMKAASFQNLAGRAGRLFQDTLGIVAFASQDKNDEAIEEFVMTQVGELVSTLEEMVNDVLRLGWDLNLSSLVKSDSRWTAFGQYLAHSYRQLDDHERFVGDTEKLLRSTWGYRRLEKNHPVAAEQLIDATRDYALSLKKMGGGVLQLVDTTGFSAETVMEILSQKKLIPKEASEWSPSKLFAASGALPKMIGMLLDVRELGLEAESGRENQRIADVMAAWVGGKSVAEIARLFYSDEDFTKSITLCCTELFRKLTQNSAWGTGALMALSELDLANLPSDQVDEIRSIPAMLFYGVSTANGVLMRTLDVPRSTAEAMGEFFKSEDVDPNVSRITQARRWLSNQPATVWDSAKPNNSKMSGSDYKQIWQILNGEFG